MMSRVLLALFQSLAAKASYTTMTPRERGRSNIAMYTELEHLYIVGYVHWQARWLRNLGAKTWLEAVVAIWLTTHSPLHVSL